MTHSRLESFKSGLGLEVRLESLF